MKVPITIDGRTVEAEEGVPLLRAALDAGFSIPHFCYHPGIGAEGSCRLCLVEVEGFSKLLTSCTVAVKEGMVVRTDSQAAKQARRSVLEFFLLNHPLDCPICDKGGECPLQNFALDEGQSRSRMEFEKIRKDKHLVIGEHIVLDRERCVLCNRCVRFLRDLTGREELGIRNRGVRSEIFVPEGMSLTSGFTGNLADMCPVGALTTREFRFKARPWEMDAVNSVCGVCSLGCSVSVWRKRGEVLRLTPRVEPKVNEWWLCDKGRFSAQRLMNDRVTDTLETPHRTAGRIRGISQGTLAIAIDSNRTNEEFHQLRSFAGALGGLVFADVRLEAISVTRRLRDVFPAALEEADTIAVMGDVEKTHPVLVTRIRRLMLSGSRRLLTAGSRGECFGDLGPERIDLDADGFESAWMKITGAGNRVCVLLDEALLNERTAAVILKRALKTQVAVLHRSVNARGFLDQWDDACRPVSDLRAQIERGKIEGLICMGALDESVSEYMSDMKMLVQFAVSRGDVSGNADAVLPLPSFLEQDGTITNTFGRVLRLRRATRIFPGSLEPAAFLAAVARELGIAPGPSGAQRYEEFARQLKYPKSWAAVAESSGTYEHYERVMWR